MNAIALSKDALINSIGILVFAVLGKCRISLSPLSAKRWV
jgi:hypothetical protein